MALEHLSDEDLQHLKERGLAGVSDEGLQLLKLPEGHGIHPDALPAEAPSEPEPQDVTDIKRFANDVVLGEGRMSGHTLAGKMVNGMQTVADLSKMGVKGWKELGGLVGPKTEWLAEHGAGLLLPQTKLAVGMSALQGASELEPAAKALMPAVGGRAVKVVKPNVLENAAGGLIQATARVPQRFGAAVVADPTILDESVTPGLKAVSKEMGDYFEKKGVNINRSTLKNLFNRTYVPSEGQVGNLNKMIEQTIGKIEDVANKVPGAMPPTEEELVFAERAANAMSRSTQAQANKHIMSNAKGAQKVFLEHLDRAGFKELPDLKAKYFRALAQDAFQDWLPQNKTGGPNALSALLMGKEALSAVGHAANMNLGSAAVSGLKAAAFSPILVGQGIRAANAAVTSPAAGNAAKLITLAALNAMGKKKDEGK